MLVIIVYCMFSYFIFGYFMIIMDVFVLEIIT